MNLPNYFLADLPEASLDGGLITEACLTLKRNRERYLVHRSTQSLVAVLCAVAKGWLDRSSPFRMLALEQGPAATGFSRATLERGLDSFFQRLTPEEFDALLEQDLGDLQRLDRLLSAGRELGARRAAIARPPELLVHVASGHLPSPTFRRMVLGVLARSAQFVQCVTGSSLLPRLFAHSLYQAEPKLGASLEIADWRGGAAEPERALFDAADCVSAGGSDEMLAALRQRLPAKTRFLGYGQRVSFAYVAGAMLSSATARGVAAAAAADVTAWDQLDSLSPHVIYVEQGGVRSPEHFAEMLAEELARREEAEPRGELPAEAAAAIASRRSLYELRAAHSPDTRLWPSPNSTAWTVVYEADPRFQTSCRNRFIYVKGIKDLSEAQQNAESVHAIVSTVGLAAPEAQARHLATLLARWGAARVCPLGRMHDPPLAWRHDGRPALGDLLTWTDYEMQ